MSSLPSLTSYVSECAASLRRHILLICCPLCFLACGNFITVWAVPCWVIQLMLVVIYITRNTFLYNQYSVINLVLLVASEDAIYTAQQSYIHIYL